MAESDVDALQGDALGPGLRPAMEVDERLTAVVGEDLDLAPGNAVGASAQRLHHGLLAGEARRQFAGAATAEGDFERRVDALEEAVAELRQRGLDAGDFDYVDTCSALLHAFDSNARAESPTVTGFTALQRGTAHRLN